MVRSRYLLAATCLWLLACGGGGGGGGGGGHGGSAPPKDMVAVGWLGGGYDGWQTFGESQAGSGDAFLDDPGDVFVGPDGSIYVSDSENDRIVKWTADGTWVGWIGGGRDGWQTGENTEPIPDASYLTGRRGGMAVGPDGTVYAAMDGFISRWTPDGEPDGWLGGTLDGWQTGPTPDEGYDYWSFDLPGEICVDGDGNIYLADERSVRKWNRDGISLGWIGGGSDGWKTTSGVPPPASADLRTFSSAFGLAVDGDGNIYVTDWSSRRIVKWTSDGRAVGWTDVGENGWRTTNETGDLQNPRSIDVGADGTIYVAHGSWNHVSRWSADGAYGGWIGNGSDGWQLGDSPNPNERIADERGFHETRSVVVEPGGSIAVVDSGNSRVCRWSADGRFLGWIGGGQDGWRGGDAPDRSDARNGFAVPEGISSDAAGNLYVFDSDAERVSKWTADGTAVGWIGGGNTGWQESDTAPALGGDYRTIHRPVGIFVDADGTIYVVETLRGRVSKWSADGDALGWIGEGWDGWRTERWYSRGTEVLGYEHPRAFRRPYDVAVDAQGRVYVADGGNNRVSRWSPDGVALGWIGGDRSGWRTGRGADRGTERDEMWVPGDVVLDGKGRMFVMDARNNRVSLWTTGGDALGWLGGGKSGLQRQPARWTADLEDEGRLSLEGGDTFRKFSAPAAACLVGEDLYVADSGNHRISLWSIGREPRTARGWLGHGRDGWQTGRSSGSPGQGLRSFRSPTGVHVDAEGNLYVVDENDRVVKWSPAPDAEETP